MNLDSKVPGGPLEGGGEVALLDDDFLLDAQVETFFCGSP